MDTRVRSLLLADIGLRIALAVALLMLMWLIIAPPPNPPPLAVSIPLITINCLVVAQLFVKSEEMYQRYMRLRYGCSYKPSRQLLGTNPHLWLTPRTQLHLLPVHLQPP